MGATQAPGARAAAVAGCTDKAGPRDGVVVALSSDLIRGYPNFLRERADWPCVGGADRTGLRWTESGKITPC